MSHYEKLYIHLFGKVEDAVNILSEALAAEPGQERAALARAFDCLVKAQESCEELYIQQGEEN